MATATSTAATSWSTAVPAHVADGDPGHAQLHNSELDCITELRQVIDALTVRVKALEDAGSSK